MGYNKLSFVINGKTILRHSVDAAINSKAESIVVVTGANREENETFIKDLDVNFVHNYSWEKGIGGSVKCGLNHLIQESTALDAVLISVCDQPYLTSEIFDQLINAYLHSDKKIIASLYQDSLGVPVLYDKSLFQNLLKIPDEHGAKKYIVDKAEKDMLDTIPFPKGEIDIDTIEDIKKITSP